MAVGIQVTVGDTGKMAKKTKLPFCPMCKRAMPTEEHKRLAILVMDHRTKFQGSSILTEWRYRFGDLKPEDAFPELKNWDKEKIDAYFQRTS